MKIVFLETNTLGEVDLSLFDSLGEVVKYPQTKLEEVADRIQDADVLVVNKIPMYEKTLKKADQLKLICITATGTNIIDFEYTNQKKITVANIKGYSTQSVVQHTFALFFYLYHKLPYYDQYVKSGEYIKSDIFRNGNVNIHELYGKTWGIIGLGEIGRGVAEVAKLFGCNVVYYSTSGKNQNTRYEQVDLNTLLERSDIVSIHAPLNAMTRDLIGENELRRMKKSGILLNLGRGPIIKEEALAKALTENWITAAGLDVLSKEPMAPSNPLYKIKDSTKLLITPHIAWATVEARQRAVEEVVQNIEAFLRGNERNIVRE